MGQQRGRDDSTGGELRGEPPAPAHRQRQNATREKGDFVSVLFTGYVVDAPWCWKT